MSSYYLTDKSNGYRFIDQHRDKAMYVPSRGWYVYDGMVWRNDADEAMVTQLAKEVTDTMRHEARPSDDDDDEVKALKESS